MPFQKFFVFLASAVLAFSAHADVSGSWIHHPTLDIYSYLYGSNYVKGLNQATNNVQKLVESDRYLYALIAGGHYFEHATSVHACSEIPFFIARVDKTVPGSKVEPLATTLPVSGLGVTAMEYSQDLQCLAAAYDNNCIDFIYDDGRLLSVTDLKYFTRPGGSAVRSISFNHNSAKAVAATDYGVLIIDPQSARVENMISLEGGVDFANLMGDNLLVASEGIIRVFPLAQPPVRLSDAPILTSSSANAPAGILSEDGVKHSFGMYPVDDNSMIFLAPALAANVDGVSVNLLTLPADPANEEAIIENVLTTSVNFAMLGARDDVAPSFRELSLVAPTRNGIILRTENNAYLFDWKSGSEAGEGNPSVKLTTYRQPQDAAPDVQQGPLRYKPVTTFDGETFWVFRPRLGFQQRRVEGVGNSAVWSDSSDVVGVNALAAGMPRYLYYSPAYGLMARADGRNMDFTNDLCQSDGLCAYRDGVWTPHTLILTNLKSGWLRTSTAVLMGYAHGACPDPVLTQYVYSRGETTGIKRQNLEDPSDVLLMTRNDNATDYSNRAVVCNRQYGSEYSTSLFFNEFGFDNDGTLWTAFGRLQSTEFPELHAELWYWTVADREAVKKGEDYASHPMKILNIPGIASQLKGFTYCGKSEKNKNLIIALSGDYDHMSVVYDHNGTLDDPSDDRYVVLKNLKDETGDVIEDFGRCNRFVEDPYDGSLLIGTKHGIMVTSREQLFSEDGPHFTWLNPKDAKDGSMVAHFGIGGLNGIVGMDVDKEGRKWILFESGPVFCLSADRSTILAEFDHNNSPLPKSTYLNLICNPETNSVFIGSYYGLTEFVPEGNGSVHWVDRPAVMPRVVESHFRGFVNITGLTDAGDYALIAPDGSEIALPHPVSGRIQIHPDDLAPGLYRLKDSSLDFVINRKH